jgi:drug/metabolite transporter (DMT)-like permease
MTFPQRTYFGPALVRDRTRPARCSHRGQAGGTNGGKLVTPVSALLIFIALILYILGQLFLKHAMESDLRSARFKKNFAVGLSAMTVSFFITLGLLQHFDLSYLYPFQGLSVVIISLLAAAILREKLTPRLFIGAALISAGVVLVSLS